MHGGTERKLSQHSLKETKKLLNGVPEGVEG